MFQAFAYLLNLYFELIPNYAFAIGMLTVTVMLLLFPLTAKGTRSMLAMQKLQPEIKRLQQQHKDDRQALNEAMMAFYKEHKINPVSGCLPLLLQMPIFIVLYNVIAGLTKKVDGEPQPKYLSESTELYQALKEAGGKMVSFGVDLARSGSSAWKDGGLGDAWPFITLILVMVGAQYFQQAQLNRRNPSAAANPQAQMMQKFFPGFFGFISWSIPAGVVLYWLISNVFRIGQQEVMYRFDPHMKELVASEVREVEAKASEIKRTHRGAAADSAKRGSKPGGGKARSAGSRPQSRRSRRNR